MTDRELKKHLRKLGITLILALILISVLSLYTLSSAKAKLSIYDNNSEEVNKLQALGINEEEFKTYLAIFGNLVIEDVNENEKVLNMASNFINEIYPMSEEENAESDLKCYDVNIVNKICKELKGQTIKENSNFENYVYDEEKNSYIQNKNTNKILVCNQIDDIIKDNEKIEVTYELEVINSQEQLENEESKDAKKYKVRAVILNNSDYEYSKYFVSNIEKIAEN